MTPKYAKMVKLYELAAIDEARKNATSVELLGSAARRKAAERATSDLRESIAAKDTDISSFDFGRFFEECFGFGSFRQCKDGDSATEIMETAGPITTAAFQATGGQIIYGLILDAYNSPDFVFTKRIKTRKTIYDFEKVAGVSPIGDEVQIVRERDIYPVAGVTEKYRNAPVLQKRGFRVQLTREVLFFDRTGQLQQMASNGGLSMGQNREKRAVDSVIDENAGAASALPGSKVRCTCRPGSVASPAAACSASAQAGLSRCWQIFQLTASQT